MTTAKSHKAGAAKPATVKAPAGKVTKTSVAAKTSAAKPAKPNC